MIDLKLLESHAKLVQESRDRLLFSRFDPQLQQPLFGERVLPKFSGQASGCRVTDLQGNQFLDWTGGQSSNLLGHRHPAVVDAIKYWAIDEQVHELDPPVSSDSPFTDPQEVTIAGRLCELFHGDLMVGFTRGRREAIYCATEIARTITQRPMIAVHAVHPTKHLHCQDQRFHFGRSHFAEENERIIPVGDLKSLRWTLKNFPDKIAAYLIDPFEFEYPNADCFSEIEALLKQHGCLLILDESSNAFRMEMGGAQEHFSIHPDLTVAGDTLAGPFSFSAILGQKELMQKAWRTTMRTQDRPGGLTLDVVNASLNFAIENHLPAILARAGKQLKEEFNHIAKQSSLRCELVGHPSHLSIQFAEYESFEHNELTAAFSLAALEQGVITYGEFWPNVAHDNRAVEETLLGLERAIESLESWIAEATDSTFKDIGIGPGACGHEIRGRIDSLNMIRKTMVLSGWILIDGKPVELSAVSENGDRIEAEKVIRSDLGVNMPQFLDAASAGFKLSLPVESIKKTSRFLVDGHRDGKRVYRTLLVHDPHLQTSGPYPFGEGCLMT
jgi:glutamate-1-semialdehyde 2,1-aminomutase